MLWLMAGIDPAQTSLPSGTFPNDDAFETLNDYGQQGFDTPCLESFESGQRRFCLPEGRWGWRATAMQHAKGGKAFALPPTHFIGS